MVSSTSVYQIFIALSWLHLAVDVAAAWLQMVLVTPSSLHSSEQTDQVGFLPKVHVTTIKQLNGQCATKGQAFSSHETTV